MQAEERREGNNEFDGRSVEEAVQVGLEALGLTRDDVYVEILAPGSRGFFGLGAAEARVRLIPKKPVHTQQAAAAEAQATPREAVAEPLREAPARPAAAPEPVAEPHVDEEEPGLFDDLEEEEEEGEEKLEPASAHISPEEAAAAQEILEGLLQRMRVRAEVFSEIVEPEPGQRGSALVLDIKGQDVSALIGRQGETMSSLQYVLRLMVSHRLKRWLNVVVDVDGYKRRRENQLRQLAQRMAERAILNGRPLALEAMPANERRIVHLALRNHPKVYTQSVGEADQRKVTIMLREQQPPS
ncbi:MAG: KH domain-containing protein [Chloroflexi bacterium]|nr:KH domain-containing protein [Chloroflexota bacterium]